MSEDIVTTIGATVIISVAAWAIIAIVIVCNSVRDERIIKGHPIEIRNNIYQCKKVAL